MKKSDWFFVITVLLAVIAIDQAIKGFFGNPFANQSGPFYQILWTENHGAMLGLLSDLPLIIRVVTFSTCGAFLLFIYGIVQFFLSQRLMVFRIGLSILLGGIFGNVIDRIRLGYVLDYLSIGYSSHFSPIFNFADAIQWVGYLMIMFSLIRDGKKFWPDIENRKNYWVNKSFQLRYSLFLSFAGLSFCVLVSVFGYTFLRTTIIEIRGYNPLLLKQFLNPFLITIGCLGLAFTILLFVIGIYVSHRIAGPVYAFERFLKQAIRSNDTKVRLKLRAGDDFKEFEKLADELQDKLASMQKTS